MYRQSLLLFVLLASLFGMAGVYQLMWYANPDQFRVQEGVNFLPTNLYEIATNYYAYGGDSKPLPGPARQQAIQDAENKLVDAYQKFQTATFDFTQEQAEYKKLQDNDTIEYKAFEDSQWAQADNYVQSKVAPYQAELADLSLRMNAILAKAHVTRPEELPPGLNAVNYYKLAVQLASAGQEEAQVKGNSSDYVLHHLTDFQRLPAQQQYIADSNKMRGVEDQVFALQNSMMRDMMKSIKHLLRTAKWLCLG